MKLIHFLIFLGFVSPLPLHAKSKKLVAKSGSKRVQVLELYSSEGCSSCPPADKWLSGLRKDKGLWSEFVPLVFHVDYWNYLGWKDKLSTHEMTERQVKMAQQWSVPSVYTPGVVCNGEEWRDWRQQKRPTIKSDQIQTDIGLTVYQDRDLNFSALVTQSKERPLVARVALLGMGIKSDVKTGENAGQVLRHDFVVLRWKTLKLEAKKNQTVTFRFDQPNEKTEGLAAVIWVETPNSLTPIQATGGFL